jgi:dihydropteroate synthase
VSPPTPASGSPEPFTGAGRCLVMGVINVTPDSFSDGGLWLDPGAAVEHGLELVDQGADLVDVGGESTRPGAERVAVEEELRRVVPVVAGLSRAGVRVSVDTMRADVALRAVDAGAVLVNDVSGGLADSGMAKAVAGVGVPYVAMHWRGHSDVMQDHARYRDVVADVAEELLRRVASLIEAGMDPGNIVLDPGLGFAKTAEHNWRILAHLEQIVALGKPVLVGASRKRFLGTLLAGPAAPPVPTGERDAATAASTVIAAEAGAWCVRVHDVRASADAVRVAAAVRDARTTPVAHTVQDVR